MKQLRTLKICKIHSQYLLKISLISKFPTIFATYLFSTKQQYQSFLTKIKQQSQNYKKCQPVFEIGRCLYKILSVLVMEILSDFLFFAILLVNSQFLPKHGNGKTDKISEIS